jgi:PIN domain nuclease of toxin-antitoxin system
VGEQVARWKSDRAVLLDTHVWLRWLDPSLGRVPTHTATVIQEAQQRGGVMVSDVSIWELALKAGRGSLSLSLPLRDWVDRACSAPGIRVIPVARNVLLAMHDLPARTLGDPFDRFLVACALTMGAAFVTADRQILREAPRLGAQVLPAR